MAGATGVMANIRNMFSGAPAENTQQQSGGGVKQGADVQNLAGQVGPDGKPIQQQQQQPKAPQDPLAAFANLWDNSGSEGKKKAPKFELTPDVIQEASDSLDFTDAFGDPTEFMDQLINQKNPKALTDAMNKALRKLYSTSLQHHSVLTDRFVDARSSYDREGLGPQVTQALAKKSLKSIAEKSPVAAKMLEGIQKDLLDKNPDATPEWLDEQSKKFFMSIAGMIAPEEFVQGQKGNQDKTGLQVDEDWNSFFDGKKS